MKEMEIKIALYGVNKRVCIGSDACHISLCLSVPPPFHWGSEEN